jgi:uncharacterized repeat protein (TIGR01451 family)
LTPTVTLTPSPADLTIAKTSNPASTTSGNVVTYSLTVGNAGGTPSAPVTVEDILPAGVTLLSSSGTNGFSCGAPAPGNIMACSGGNLPANSSATITIIVLVNTPCTNLSPFVNRATVNPGNVLPESNFGNNTAVATTAVTDCPGPTGTATSIPTSTGTVTTTATRTATVTATALPDLAITKSGPASVNTGDAITYTLTVSNNGTTATNVVVQDNLPAQVTFVSAAGSNGFTCDNAGNVVGCVGSFIPQGGSATITIFGVVTGCASPLVNTAVVNPGNPAPIAESSFANNSSTVVTTVNGCPTVTVTPANTSTPTLTRTFTPTNTPVPTNTPTITSTPLPDLSITKTGPSTVTQGSSITYVITVANSGSFASGVVVQDNLPPQVTFVSASGGFGFNCDQAAGVVGCTGGTLAPGGSATITIFGVVTGCASPLVNTAVVNPGNVILESNFANNTASVVTTETGCPAATVTATSGVPNTPTITPTLNPGSLSVSKVSNPNSVVAGQPVSYVVTVFNSDVNPAPNVQFVDALPAGVTFASAQDNAPGSGVPFSCGSANGEVVCSGATIPAGGSRSVTISVVTDNPCVVVSPVRNIVRLNPNGYPIVVVTPGTPTPTLNPGPTAVADTTIINCITATSSPTITRTPTATFTSTPSPTVTNTPAPTNTPTVTLTPSVDLSITKFDSPDPVSNPGGGVNGGNIQYTLVISNTGSVSAANVTVIDTLENGSNFRCPGTPIAFQCNPSDPNPFNAVTYLSAAGDNGFVCDVSTTPDAFGFPQEQVGCTGGQIGPNGGATITIVVATTAGCTGQILNRAVVDPTNNIAESNEGNNTAFSQSACGAGANTPTPFPTTTPSPTGTNTPVPTATFTATALPPTPFAGISFSKSANPTQVTTSGQPITYTLSIANSNSSATTLSPSAITDVLDARTTFVNATNPTGNNITCGSTGTPGSGSETVVCGNGQVPANSTAQITIVVLYTGPNCGTPVSNTANLFVGGQLNNTSNTTTVSLLNCTPTVTITSTPTITLTPTLTATPTNTVTVTPTATPGFDIAVAKSAPATVTANSSFNYVVTVTNNGPNTATNLQILDNLPPSTQYSFSSATPSGGGFVCTFNAGPPQTVNCTQGTLTNGQSITITINGTVTIAACNSTLINQAQVVTPNTNPANDTAATATNVNACADLDVVRTDVSPVFGPESTGSGSTWRSTVRYLLFNDSLTPITGITFTLNQQNLGNNTNSFGNFSINGTSACPAPASCPAPPGALVVAGWTCTVAYPDFQHSVFTCTGDLAADPGTPNNNVSGGGASQILLDFEIDNETFGGPPATVAGTSDWANTVSCTSPTPCTNLVATPANSDGSQLIFTDSDTIAIAADVDLGATNDVPAGQDLSAASATTTAGFAYTIFNDSFTPIGPATSTTVTFEGSLSGSAPRNTAIATVANGGGSPASAWACTTTQSSWSCTGTFTAETAASALNNAPDAGAPDSQVTITLLVPVGPGDAAGQTVTFTPNAVTCTGTLTCTSFVTTPGNIDGGNLLYGVNTDTLVP